VAETGWRRVLHLFVSYRINREKRAVVGRRGGREDRKMMSAGPYGKQRASGGQRKGSEKKKRCSGFQNRCDASGRPGERR
jgi:hypothetical protein